MQFIADTYSYIEIQTRDQNSQRVPTRIAQRSGIKKEAEMFRKKRILMCQTEENSIVAWHVTQISQLNHCREPGALEFLAATMWHSNRLSQSWRAKILAYPRGKCFALLAQV
jgi:hypothetical protein